MGYICVNHREMKNYEILRLGLRLSKDDAHNLLENIGRVRNSLMLSSETYQRKTCLSAGVNSVLIAP